MKTIDIYMHLEKESATEAVRSAGLSGAWRDAVLNAAGEIKLTLKLPAAKFKTCDYCHGRGSNCGGCGGTGKQVEGSAVIIAIDDQPVG